MNNINPNFQLLQVDLNDENLWMYDKNTKDYTLNWYDEVILKDDEQNKIMDLMRLDPINFNDEDDFEPIVTNFVFIPLENKYRMNFFSYSGLGYFMKEKYFLVELSNLNGKILTYTRLPHPGNSF